MKSDLIVFGRSPFISTIAIEPLLEKYTTLGLNAFVNDWATDYAFCFDHYIPGQAGHVFYSRFCTNENPAGTPYHPKPSETPLILNPVQEGTLALAFRCFTVSSALNWAILQGFSRIYLVGIDHVETDAYFQHYDGLVGRDGLKDGEADCLLTPQSHRDIKEFIYKCAGHVEIFQTNAAVRDDWRLPFKPIEELYQCGNI